MKNKHVVMRTVTAQGEELTDEQLAALSGGKPPTKPPTTHWWYTDGSGSGWD